MSDCQISVDSIETVWMVYDNKFHFLEDGGTVCWNEQQAHPGEVVHFWQYVSLGRCTTCICIAQVFKSMIYHGTNFFGLKLRSLEQIFAKI